MKRQVLSLAGALLAGYALAACGRSELDFPEDVPDADVMVDVPLDRPDTPDVPDVPDVPDIQPACSSDRDCNDGLICNGAEVCAGGRCVAGPAMPCNDGVVCTVDQCVEGRGCVSVPDNNRCVAPAFCDPMRDCTPVECTRDAECDNGDPCDGAERCGGGRCVRGSPLSCEDGVACTLDRCIPGVGCQSIPDDAVCNDGRFCNGVERCLPGRGCAVEMPVLCDDGDPCTTDSCDEARRSCITRPADADGDGFGPAACAGGRDCNDNDRTVNPGAAEACLDGRDNNCDGRTDCADVACAGTPACGMCVPTGPEVCNDRLDNDCDRLADCADADCARTPACVACVPTGPEADPMACADGRDNDCNGLTDCADPLCARLPGCVMCVPTSRTEICGDGRDNDCNGAADCADATCAMTTMCSAPNETCATAIAVGLPGRVSGSTAVARDDFTPACAGMGSPDVVYTFRNPARQTIILDTGPNSYDTALIVFRDACAGAPVACDDDGGGGTNSRVVLTDAAPGTYFVVVDGWSGASGAFQLNLRLAPVEVCGNGVDDDGDMLVDCADRADCGTLPMCMMCVPTGPETDAMSCFDGRDNDCDGFVDCSDFDCGRSGVCGCVPQREVCNDGVDNDCDLAVDCADMNCAGSPLCPTCVPTGTEADVMSCADGRDNDCDGQTDCADTFCQAQPVCAPPPVNDTCARPLPIAVPSTTTGTLDGARNDYTPTVGTPGCQGGAGGDVVYALRVARAATLTVDTLGSTFDTVLYVRTPQCEMSTQVACNDDTGGTTSRVTFAATPGIYYVIVDGFSATSRGRFVLNVAENLGREICNNLVDDDGDRAVDCADSDCAMDPACLCVPSPETTDAACTDGRDNDCDRQFDCADADCRNARACCRPTGAESDARSCADGIDNDCDGLRDCADPGCAPQPTCCRPTAMREMGVAACTDGIDNDCDGVSDCGDSDCRPSATSGGECCNGVDDNANRLVDEFACACETSAQCSGVGAGGLFPSNTCWNTTFRVCAPRCDLLGGNLFCSNFFAGTRCNTVTGECVR
jgi:hypothetical protein